MGQHPRLEDGRGQMKNSIVTDRYTKRFNVGLLETAKKGPVAGKEIEPLFFFSNNDFCPDNSLSYKET